MVTRIYGTNGADRIVQNYRADLEVFAYAGNDTIILNRVDDLGGYNYVNAGNGADTVRNEFEGGNDIFLGGGNDTYIHTGFAGDLSDYDVVSGGGGADKFQVKTLQSVYYGDGGNDGFLSAGFENTFNGGSGVDTISYMLQNNSSQRGRGVYVDLGGNFAKTAPNRYEDLFNIENATGTNVNDTLIGSGRNNSLNGKDGNDVLEGLGGADQLIGEKGGDDLYGGNGGDDLYGGSSRDTLVGGRGHDFLEGGGGADRFVFNTRQESTANAQRDVITDFARSEGDKIDLRSMDADSTRGGNQAFDFVGTATFSGDAGELRYRGHIISADINGDRMADFQLDVNLTRYVANDFLL